MNKKAQANDTAIILSIFTFQAFVILMLGFIDVSPTTSTVDNSLFDFGNIITNIQELGWGNTLIFTPLLIAIIYIIARLIRGGG